MKSRDLLLSSQLHFRGIISTIRQGMQYFFQGIAVAEMQTDGIHALSSLTQKKTPASP